jgi:hypothetical protein
MTKEALNKIDILLQENLGGKIALGLGGGALGYMAGEHFSDDIGNLGKDIGSGLSHASNAIGHTLQTSKIGADPSFEAMARDNHVGQTLGEFAKKHSGLIGAGLASSAAMALAPRDKRQY